MAYYLMVGAVFGWIGAVVAFAIAITLFGCPA